MAYQDTCLLMSKALLVMIIILAVMLVGIIVLYFVGRHLQKKQEQNQKLLEANRQEFTMLVIDKKKMRVTEAGLPQNVIDSLPKIYRRSKMYVVKGKIGQKVMPFICEKALYDQIPVKKEIKAGISGLYMLDAKGVRGQLEKPTKKLSFRERLKQRKLEKQQALEQEQLKKEKAEKKALVKQRQEEKRLAVQQRLQNELNKKDDTKDSNKRIQVVKRGNNKKRK